MPRALIAVSLLLAALFVAATAEAREEKARAACLDSATPPEDRLLACTRYLRGGQPETADQVLALQARGNAYADLERYDEALADFDAAIALDPENAELYRERGLTQSWKGNEEAAVADYDRALQLVPDHPWTLYAKGFSLAKLDRFDEALACYDQALAISPRYLVALEARAVLHLQRGNELAGMADYDAVLAIDPYRARIYSRRGELLAVHATDAEALRDYRLALLLDPNELRATWGLERLEVPVDSTALEPRDFTFAPPPVGLSIDYLQLEVLPQEEKDEMVEAIEGLVGWFAESDPLPLPLSALFVSRRVTAAAGRDTALEQVVTFPEVDRREELQELAVDYLDGLWPTTFPTPQGPGATIEYDREALARAWGLAPGETVAGEGAVVVHCPAEGVPPDVLAALVGCLPGQDVTIGHLAWTAKAGGSEEILVPAGRLATVKLVYEEQAELTILGQTRTRTAVTTWWWSPEIGWWVKRRHEKDGKIEVTEAVTIRPPS